MKPQPELEISLTVAEIDDILEALETNQRVYSEPTETAKIKLLKALKEAGFPEPEL
jgi:hypothetical protein